MSDENYKLTRHKTPNPGDTDNLEPPAEGYVPADTLTTRRDHVTILWRPASAVRFELEGESVESLEELLELMEANDE